MHTLWQPFTTFESYNRPAGLPVATLDPLTAGLTAHAFEAAGAGLLTSLPAFTGSGTFFQIARPVLFDKLYILCRFSGRRNPQGQFRTADQNCLLPHMSYPL